MNSASSSHGPEDAVICTEDIYKENTRPADLPPVSARLGYRTDEASTWMGGAFVRILPPVILARCGKFNCVIAVRCGTPCFLLWPGPGGSVYNHVDYVNG